MPHDDTPMTVVFDQPVDRLSLNSRMHRRQQIPLIRAWRVAARDHAMAQLGRSPTERRRSPCFVRVYFGVKSTAQRRDPHNMAATEKPIVDGLVDAGVWPDDDEHHVLLLPCRFFRPDPLPPRGTRPDLAGGAAFPVRVELIPRGSWVMP